MGHHHHGHDHETASSRIGLAFALNVMFTVIELVGAWHTSSTAIAADALHDLGDSLSLGFAWVMQRVSTRAPTDTYSYGFRRLSLLGALVNAVVLLGGGVAVLSEAIPRLRAPGEPDAAGMLGLALLGVAVNGAAVLRTRKGKSLNERVVTWHLLEDVLGWVAVLIVSVVMLFVHLPILDPLLCLVVTLWVGLNAARNLKRTVALFLQATPTDVDLEELRAAALELPGVVDLVHVHLWSQEGEHHVFTAVLVVEPGSLEGALTVQERVRTLLRELGVEHATIELSLPGRPTGGCGHR